MTHAAYFPLIASATFALVVTASTVVFRLDYGQWRERYRHDGPRAILGLYSAWFVFALAIAYMTYGWVHLTG